ncbi:MAG: hypothetical protein LWW95_11850 [Candidatus Desulfofervidus auxilii]|nr:hypothetical protein [Candidatus Desulfofervidus auxilii]
MYKITDIFRSVYPKKKYAAIFYIRPRFGEANFYTEILYNAIEGAEIKFTKYILKIPKKVIIRPHQPYFALTTPLAAMVKLIYLLFEKFEISGKYTFKVYERRPDTSIEFLETTHLYGKHVVYISRIGYLSGVLCLNPFFIAFVALAKKDEK